jgi:probable blue pigment (indigoidine) exporter
VIGTSVPIWVAWLAWPILGERVSPQRALGLAIALCGISFLIGGNGFDASLENCRDCCLRSPARSASRSARC